jgi:cytochrome c-type protein NapB
MTDRPFSLLRQLVSLPLVSWRPFTSWRPFLAAAVAASMVVAVGVAQEAGGAKGLRGDVPLADTATAPDTHKQLVPAEGFGRAYRQQPPLIPHKIDGYQINTTNNQCMNCHDWPGNTKVNAPKISETHYVDRQGARLDKVAGTRYFCTQCHVPQTDAKALIGNSFQNAIQAK